MKVHLFADLDRTILPNGLQSESEQSRPLLRRFMSLPGVSLTYVSGRDIGLIQKAIQDYEIPLPDYAVADVGTAMYRITGQRWQPVSDWQRSFGAVWNQSMSGKIIQSLACISKLILQEPEKQSSYKVSYYTEPAFLENIKLEVGKCLGSLNEHIALVSSIDETLNIGLLDILPQNATKLYAVRFLVKQCCLKLSEVVYCGDSGNDLPVLESNIPAVIVANAQSTVKDGALQASMLAGTQSKLYLAEGVCGLNGNYAAGVLEGVGHFIPEIAAWLQKETCFSQGTA